MIGLSAFLLGGLAQLQMKTDLHSMLPDKDPAVAQSDEIARSFGGDPIVVLLKSKHPGEQLDKQHIKPLLGLEGKLSRLPNEAVVYGPGTMLNQIAGHTQQLVSELAGRRDAIRSEAADEAKKKGLSEERANAAGKTSEAQFDVRYGQLLVQALPAGLPTLHNPGFVRSVAFGDAGAPKPQWRFVLPTPDTTAIMVRPRQGLDESATRELVNGVKNAVAESNLDVESARVSGVPVVVSSLGQEVRSEAPLLGGVAIVAVGACFLLVPWTRWTRRLLPIASTLLAVGLTLALFGWVGHPLSLGVVAFLPVLLGIGSYYPTYIAQRAKRRTLVMVVLGSACSFATLSLSPLPFVRDLGLAVAIGVLLSAGVGMVLLRNSHSVTPPPIVSERASNAGLSKRARIITLILAVAVGSGGWLALPGLRMEGSIDKLAAGLPALNDARAIEGVMGSSGEMDVVLSGPNVLSAQAMAWTQEAQNKTIARHGDQVRAVVSPSTLLPFLGARPSADQINAGVRLLPPYLTNSVFRNDNKVALLSFGVKLDDVGRLQSLQNDLKKTLPPPPPGYRAEITGLPMAAARGDELLSHGRLLSNIAGIVAAGVVLVVGLRRRTDAGRAVLAASVATGAGLFFMWALDIPLSPITVALGSLTAAVGCEFTVMFAESVRKKQKALRRSVLLAALTSAVGYLVLTISQLTAIRDFGLLLSGSVVLALGAAWLVVESTVREEEHGSD